MRIALTADPELPVPPKLYGGIERVVDLLARGLAARGHDVTLFAHGESTTPVELVAFPGASSRSLRDGIANAAAISGAVLGGRFDLVHSFSRIAYLTPILAHPIPKLMTYQREVTRRSVALGHQLSRGSLQFSAISRQMMRPVQDIGTWHLVYNGVELGAHRLAEAANLDAPLVFLGRIEPIKGPHLAIEIARRTNSKLVIAGNIPRAHQDFFNHQVRPFIDGDRIAYIGPVDDAQKSDLLGAARALLMPILWEEPFGIVMAEAMACGAPVLGLRRGAVPEVVEDGVTGFVRDTVDELVDTVARLHEISRLACRQRVEALFSKSAVVDGYLAVYEAMLQARRRRAA
jgi:glycosyltransferase involved in cell wall biosynthesis